jgi:hypothetical protein
MDIQKGYIYVRNHSSYDEYNACKVGKTNNIPDRDSQYATGEIKRGNFDVVFEVLLEQMSFIEDSLQYEFCELNIRYDGGTEFYNKNIINLIEPYLINHGIKYKKLTKEEIDNLTRCVREKKINQQYIWNERDYQKTIINFSKNELLLNNKIYIELPTGGGKSYIVYNLFECLKSEFIIIISPRKIVNLQNISQKYLQILKENYVTFNYSNDNNIDKFLELSNKKIVICCTQSVEKIYEKILSNNITNITIWFDEAHWGIEDWVDKLNLDKLNKDKLNKDNLEEKNIEFWLSNNKNIKYRIFTSASPNKPKVLQKENIFGKFYSPIKIKELIELNWLSPIKPYIYSENITNVDNIKYIISDFSEKKRKYGFSFHNKQKNAFNLFYKHYLQYKNNNTQIKPFLLVSNNFTYEKEPKLQEIVLDYDYRNIKIYESSNNSIGYVVAKYSMGYDFNKLDFICISDPKLSIQDIKQCIGRGIRPDELGNNGSNKEKILIVSLPVYIDENGDNKYEKIIEVLKYLLYDIEITFEEIKFKNRFTPHDIREKKPNINDYSGINDVKSILLNLLELDNKKTMLEITYEKAKKIIVEKNIKSKESYYELCNKDNRLSKEPDVLFKNKFTNWIDYLGIERIYYDFETCKNKIEEYLILLPEIKNDLDLSLICKNLCKIDNLFPPSDLWVEYYNLKNLGEIIIINNKKKKMLVNI